MYTPRGYTAPGEAPPTSAGEERDQKERLAAAGTVTSATHNGGFSTSNAHGDESIGGPSLSGGFMVDDSNGRLLAYTPGSADASRIKAEPSLGASASHAGNVHVLAGDTANLTTNRAAPAAAATANRSTWMVRWCGGAVVRWCGGSTL